jgi:sigma-B regulation protein RsbU (phosphoserine phosphatase)
LPQWSERKAGAYRRIVGRGLLQSQLLFLAVALVVSAVQALLIGQPSLVSTLLYTFFAGNIVTFLLAVASPLYDQPFPRDWIVFLALLLPVSLIASVVGGVADRLLLRRSLESLLNWRTGDIPFACLVCFLIGVSTYAFDSIRDRMQAANSQLAQEVQRGRQELATHASELSAAFEIQSSLLPRSIPQIAGFEISCAWQPARTVSGDFFDVLVLSDTRIGICLADVSGKGISAALITANIQAALRAFAPDEPSPGNLCRRVNQALAASLPQGRFVTFVYGILDRRQMTFTYELAGHNPPFLLRGDQVIPLAGGEGIVLGLFPEAVFADHTVPLHPGDRLVLTTDGVTEAFSPEGEEFGEERLVEVARRAGHSAHAIRVNVMDAVTRFAEGNFHDDASLVIVRVQP